MNILFWVIICLSLCSCQHVYQTPFPSSYWQNINSRDEGDPSLRFPLYRAKVPSHWTMMTPAFTESIADTKKSLCEFFITEGSDTIRISIHNFPSSTIERIPPQAQIQRWQTQLSSLNPITTFIQPEAHGGFIGLSIECEGEFQQQPAKILGWAMQLAPEYYRQLSLYPIYHVIQKRADYTIKALGPPHLIDKHKNEIIAFANSFELIEELPEIP